MGRDSATNHFCTGEGCGKQVTHKPPNGPIQVMRVVQSTQVVSKFGAQQHVPTQFVSATPDMQYQQQNQEMQMTPKEIYEQQMQARLAAEYGTQGR
jgi:hypothetical protein